MDVPEPTAMSTLSLADRITRWPVEVEGNGDPEGGSRDRAGLPAGGERRAAATAPPAQRQLRPAGPCRHDRVPRPARTHARLLQCLREPIAAGSRARPPQRPSAGESGPLRRPAPARGRRRAHNLALVVDAPGCLPALLDRPAHQGRFETRLHGWSPMWSRNRPVNPWDRRFC